MQRRPFAVSMLSERTARCESFGRGPTTLEAWHREAWALTIWRNEKRVWKDFHRSDEEGLAQGPSLPPPPASEERFLEVHRASLDGTYHTNIEWEVLMACG